jgi:hypothetical protein
MHASTVLSEEIFAVEVVEALVVVCAAVHVTSEVSQLQVLGRDVAFPLVLVRECGAAAVVVEGTWEALRVLRLGLLCDGRFLLGLGSRAVAAVGCVSVV